MHDRRPAEPLVAVPARGLGQGEVDLHLGAPVAEAARGLDDGLRHLCLVEQPLVQLRRRHVGDHRSLGRDDLAAGEPDADRAARAHEHALDVLPGLADTVAVADQAHERLREHRAATARHRHPALLHSHCDHLRHEAGGRRVGAEAGVQHPRREQPVRPLRRERLLEPVAARLEQLAGEDGEAPPSEPPERLRRKPEPGRRPELRAEDAERKVRVRQEALEHAGPFRADLGGVSRRVAEQERRPSVGERGGRR